MLLQKRQQILRMSNHSELRDLRSEGTSIHSKNKYKFMVLKITLMPQIKEAFVRSNVNTKSTLQCPFQFCSDVSSIGTIYSRNWLPLFVLALLISDLKFVFLLLSLLVTLPPDIWKVFFRIVREETVHTKMCY